MAIVGSLGEGESAIYRSVDGKGIKRRIKIQSTGINEQF